MEYFIKDTKKKEIELKLFVLFLKSPISKETLLYTGVHYSLEDAFGAAREVFYSKSVQGEHSVDLDSWDILTFDKIYEEFSGEHMKKFKKGAAPSFPVGAQIVATIVKKKDLVNSFGVEKPEDLMKQILLLKGKLMKQIIDDGNISATVAMKKVFTGAEIIYMQKTITESMKLKSKEDKK